MIGSRKEMTTQDLATAVRDGLIIPDKDLEEHWRRLHSMPAKRPISDAIDERKERVELEREAGLSVSDEAADTTGGAKHIEDIDKKVIAATALIRAGFTPAASLAACGLPAIEHTGLRPVTIKEGDVAKNE